MSLKLISWNINGIRAAIKKGLWEKIDQINPDIACFQEIKFDSEGMKALVKQESLIAEEFEGSDIFEETSLNKEKWKILWNSCSIKKGYSGVATIWKNTPDLELKSFQIGLGIAEFDEEGRTLITEFKKGDLEFVVINCYYPQGGRGPHRVEYKIRFYKEIHDLVRKLQRNGKKVILTGDLNTTVKDIDLARPKENRLTTGCLPEERVALSWLLEKKQFEEEQLEIINPDFSQYQNYVSDNLEFIDSFRFFYPTLEGKYTYWDQITRARERNVGWRIDYFLVDPALKSSLKSCEIRDQVMGSDHAPVEINLD